MVILYQKAGDPEFRLTCATGTYLLAICKRLWFRKAAQLAGRPAQLDENAAADTWAYEETIDIHEEREAHYEQLAAAMEQLGEPCRSLLTAYYHKDKSMTEIASAFGYTNPENAKNQKYKCLTRLKKLFFKEERKGV